jgi:hypothetical protein
MKKRILIQFVISQLLLISIYSRIVPRNNQDDSQFENIQRDLIEELFDDYENLVDSDEILYKEVDPRLININHEIQDLMKKLVKNNKKGTKNI